MTPFKSKDDLMTLGAFSCALLLSACSEGNPEIKDTDTGGVTVECEGDNDGAIDAAELPVVTGLSVPYVSNAVGTTATVELDGTLEGGTRVWDFTSGPTDLRRDMEILDPSGLWFASEFESPEFASATFVQAPDLLGVYRQDGDEVLLLGYASREEAPADGQTLMVYETPVPAWRFPLQKGSTWGATSSYSKLIVQGIQNGGSETWSFEVDEIGDLLLQGYRMENTLRLRITMEQSLDVSVGGKSHIYRQALWMRECFGDLARAVAPLDAEEDFSVVNELHRLDVE